MFGLPTFFESRKIVFIGFKSVFKSLVPSFTAVLGSASFVGAIFCVYKAYLEGPPQLYLGLDSAWQEAWKEKNSHQESLEGQTSSDLVVEVSGAVEKPGVYKLSSESRVQDAILQAGGFDVEAEKRFIHQDLKLAAKLSDQQKIYIPFTGESSVPTAASNDVSSAEKVSLNESTAVQLQTVSGIGEVRAQKILEGVPYKNLADFQERSGLSEALQKSVLEIFFL